MKTFITSIILFIIGHGIYAQETIINAEKKQKIIEYINHFDSNNKLMGTISIFEKGKEVVNATFGEHNQVTKPIQDRKYAIGSITKMYTAILMAKLQEDNEINFNEKLDNYFPAITNADKITLKQMLNHTSGLKNYVAHDSITQWLTTPRSHQEIMDKITSEGVSFNPGDSLEYSNSAYYLLGKILEKKHQKPFRKIVEDEIAKPLQLQHTIVIDETNNSNELAKSYKRIDGDWKEMKEFHFPNAFAAGNIFSTAREQNIFLQELFAYNIISEETLNTILPVDNAWFGLGIMKAPFYEHISYGHGGDTYGTHSVAAYNPKNGIGITHIINGEDYPHTQFILGVLSIIYDKEYELPNFEEYIPDKKYFDSYIGTYGSDKLPITIKIFMEDGELKAQGEGQPSFILTPKAKHKFEFLEAGIVMTFDGYNDTMTFTQAGQEFVMTKRK